MFSNIIGQDRAVKLIENQLNFNRIPHAYLFVGPEGTGRKKTALEIARLLNCQKERKTREKLSACGECNSCKKIDKGIHPDVHLIDFSWQAMLLDEEPEKQSELKIDSIRELQKEASLMPAEGKWKVFIVDPAERLTQESANCLLKTLEEPAANSVIILLSTSSNVLPQTVVSRCQCIKFRHLADEDMAKILSKTYSSYDKRISMLTNGSVSEAVKILESPEEVELLLELWDRLKTGSVGTLELLDFSRSIARDRALVEEFISRILILIQSEMGKNRKFAGLAEFILQYKKAIRYNVNVNLLMDIILLRTKEMLKS